MLVDPDCDPIPDAAQSMLGELRERLSAARTQEAAARAEAGRLSRELNLTRRLLKFYLGGLPPAARADVSIDPATVLLSQPLIYHFDTNENLGTHTVISGWAFRPAAGWDASNTVVTLLLRHGSTAYATVCRTVQRADVAAFYAGQPPGASGGAVGLAGAGFTCTVHHDALPAGTSWKIVLRLECAGQECEHFTEAFLQL